MLEMVIFVVFCWFLASVLMPGKSMRTDPERKYRDFELRPEYNEYSVMYKKNLD